MTNQPKLAAFAVALTFDGGALTIHTLVAPNAESATAIAGVAAARQHEGNLTNMAVVELTAEWLRFALRSMESGKASGDVVSLVSDNLRTGEAAPISFASKVAEALGSPPAGPAWTGAHRPLSEGGGLGPTPTEEPQPTCPECGSILMSIDAPCPRCEPIAPAGPWLTAQHYESQLAQISRCSAHPDAPLLNGRCPLCQPTTGGAA